MHNAQFSMDNGFLELLKLRIMAKIPEYLPTQFYYDLFEHLSGMEVDAADEDDKWRTDEFQWGKCDEFFIVCECCFDVEWVDLSFDHEFGTEHAAELVVGELQEVFPTELTWTDPDTGEDHDLLHLWSYGRFWLPIKRFWTNKGTVKHGDLVWGYKGHRRWGKVIYLWTDVRTGEEVCARLLKQGEFMFHERYSFVISL